MYYITMYLSVNEIMTAPKNNRAEKFLLPSDLTANTNTCYYCVTAASDVPYNNRLCGQSPAA